MAENNMCRVGWVDPDNLAEIVIGGMDKILVIDSRSFLEFNTCHVLNSVNVVCSKIVKRRLQQDKISVRDFLRNTCHVEADSSFEVIVYDQGTHSVSELSSDCFVHVLLDKLVGAFKVVSLLRGGFLEFQAAFPSLCEDETRKCPNLTSLSQPCLSANNIGPTRILPFLYLGSQNDAINRDVLKDHDITYELNVSTNCPKPDFIMDHQFMRIPVNDNYSEKLLPHFNKAFHFLDKVRQANGCVLVHCLAGISRSPTIAIAYVMRHLRVSSEEAYRYVKSKRTGISPNFNFLGQLLEYEKQLQAELAKDVGANVGNVSDGCAAPPFVNGHKRQCLTDVRSSSKLTLNLPMSTLGSATTKLAAGDLSPTSGIARLSFGDEANHENKFRNEVNVTEQSFVASLGISVTSSHREKRCVSELFLRKTSSIKEIVSQNAIKELQPPSQPLFPPNSSTLEAEEEPEEKNRTLTTGENQLVGYETMIDEQMVRLRRPLFPAKTNCTNIIKEVDAKELFADNIPDFRATKTSVARSFLVKADVFPVPKFVTPTSRPESHDSVRLRRRPNSKEVEKKKEDGLYRAQSCPGILNCFCHSSSSSSTTSATASTSNPVAPLVMAALTSAGSLRRKWKRNVEPCLTRGVERIVSWNRYSWGNLDFGKLERLLNSDSCPDFGQITSPDNSPRREKGGAPSVIKVS